MVHLCKVKTPPDVFFIFFWVVRGVKGQKLAQKWQKIMSVSLQISGTMPRMIVLFGTQV